MTKPLGAGGFGEVHLVRHRLLEARSLKRAPLLLRIAEQVPASPPDLKSDVRLPRLALPFAAPRAVLASDETEPFKESFELIECADRHFEADIRR